MEHRRLFGHLLMASANRMTESGLKPETNDGSIDCTPQQNYDDDRRVVTNNGLQPEPHLSPWRSCKTGVSAISAEELREKEFESLLVRVFQASPPSDKLAKLANAGEEIDENTPVIPLGELADEVLDNEEDGDIEGEGDNDDNSDGEDGDDRGDGGGDSGDNDEPQSATVLPAGAFCRSPNRHLPISDLPRPANFEKTLKFLRKAKAQREARNAAEKEQEMRNYATWNVKTGQSPRQRIASNGSSWLGRDNMKLNLSSVDSADVSNRSALSCRSLSPLPSARRGTVKSAPSSPTFRTAIDMLLFPANVSSRTEGASGASERGRQVMMARLMTTPDKRSPQRTTTARKAREERQRAEEEKKVEEQENHRAKIRQLAQITAQRARKVKAKSHLSSPSHLPLKIDQPSNSPPAPAQSVSAPTQAPAAILTNPSIDPPQQTNSTSNHPGRESSSFQKALRRFQELDHMHGMDPEIAAALLGTRR